jgi:hypothetical protein
MVPAFTISTDFALRGLAARRTLIRSNRYTLHPFRYPGTSSVTRPSPSTWYSRGSPIFNLTMKSSGDLVTSFSRYCEGNVATGSLYAQAVKVKLIASPNSCRKC